MNAAEKLKSAADEAYNLHPVSCSHAVWHVIKQYVQGQTYFTANALLLQLECDPRWKQVRADELQKLANEGVLIVGGLAESPNGHVVIVYPGAAKLSGGYKAAMNGKSDTVGSKGPYALAMSRSMGSWPGATSKGDKTVWDPWANDKKFAKVKFWRFDPTAKKISAAC